MRNLTKTTEKKFTKKLDIWYDIYRDILLDFLQNSLYGLALYREF